MNNYTIYCTKEQTKKALKLDAPIETFPYYGEFVDDYVYDENEYYVIGHTAYVFPTAEQMIGWLGEQDIFVSINHISEGYSSWLKTISNNETISGNLGYLSSRKEATLAAIDTALDYLTQNQ